MDPAETISPANSAPWSQRKPRRAPAATAAGEEKGELGRRDLKRFRETYSHGGPRRTEEFSVGHRARNTHDEDTHERPSNGSPLLHPTSTGDTDAPSGEEWHDVREEEDEEDVVERETGQEGEDLASVDREWSRLRDWVSYNCWYEKLMIFPAPFFGFRFLWWK